MKSWACIECDFYFELQIRKNVLRVFKHFFFKWKSPNTFWIISHNSRESDESRKCTLHRRTFFDNFQIWTSNTNVRMFIYFSFREHWHLWRSFPTIRFPVICCSVNSFSNLENKFTRRNSCFVWLLYIIPAAVGTCGVEWSGVWGRIWLICLH